MGGFSRVHQLAAVDLVQLEENQMVLMELKEMQKKHQEETKVEKLQKKRFC